MQRGVLAHAGQGFAELVRALAPPGVGDAGLRHQIALVAGVGEHLSGKDGAIVEHDLRHVRTRLAHGSSLAQAVVEEHVDAGLLDQLAEDGLGDVWFEVPFDRPAVLPADPLEELERVAADDLLLSVIRPAEAARHHAAEVPAGFEQRHLQPFTRTGDRRHHSAGSATVDDEIELLWGRRGRRRSRCALWLGRRVRQRVREHTDSAGHLQRIPAAGRKRHFDEERRPPLLRRRHTCDPRVRA